MSASTMETVNPATGEVCGNYPLMNKEEINQLINDVSQVQFTWSQNSIEQRKQCLSRVAELLLERKTVAAQLITREMGKPITQALSEIEKCVKLCTYYINMCEQFLEPEMVQTEFYKSYRMFQPLGIILAIMPWNYPFWQVMRFAVPNLLIGNAGILKHAPNTTGTALFIEQLMLDAGLPQNIFRSLVIDVSSVPFVIHHPLIAGITLTGSVAAGKSVASEAGTALKKLVLELGGSDPYLILEDADLELAASQCVLSRLGNAGQVCIAAKRIIVVEKIQIAFEKLVLEKAKQYIPSDPADPQTNLGPLAREDLRTKLHEQVQRAIAKGARCILGGTLPQGVGYYYPATILVDVTENSPAFQEELFGPVISITRAKDETDAIRLANLTEFGLAGAVFTRDLIKGERIAHAIQAGTCAVNAFVTSDPRLPFGGIKHSGYGRELSVEGMREFVNIKTVTVTQ